LGLLEPAVAAVVRHPDPFVAEADDVRIAVAGDVGEEAEVLLARPPLGARNACTCPSKKAS
jgi:hypothetical protein